MSELHDVHLVFFGRMLRVTCDSADVARAIALIYERQCVEPSPVVGAHLHVRVEAHGADGPRIRVGSRSVRAPSADQLLRYAHLVLVNAAAASATEHQVLHGGAVEKNGRAVVLIAPSGGGKTTTTLSLVRRGWRLLSDDFVVIGADRIVQPFPRRLNLTDATLDLLGIKPPAGAVRVAASSRTAKWMVDIDELVPASVAAPTPLHTVFIVCPRDRDATTAGRRRDRESMPGRPVWRIEVDHLPAGLVERLSALPGVTGVEREPIPEGIVLAIAVEEDARIVGGLDEALATLDVAALSIQRPIVATAPSRPRPAAAPMTLADAIRAILPHDLGLSGRRFLEGTRTADVALALHRLATTLASVDGRLYRLWPGDLTATVDLIEAQSGAADPV